MRFYLIFSIFFSIFSSSKSFAAIRLSTDTTTITSFKKEKKVVVLPSKAIPKKTVWNILWGALAGGLVVFTKVVSGEFYSGLVLAAILFLIVFLVRKSQKNKLKPNHEIDIADSNNTKRSLKNLSWGMIFLGLGAVVAILGALSAQGLSVLLPFFVAITLGSVGFVFSLVSFVQAIIAYKRQEPLHKKSLISLILFSIIFGLPLVALLGKGISGLF
jgi:hypothetical protein